MRILSPRVVRAARLLLPIIAVTAASAGATRQASRPLALETLAREWSAGGEIRRCEPATDGVSECRWPPIVRGNETSELTGYRSATLGLSGLLWSRVFSDSAGAQRMIDSLDTALRAAGLAAYTCRSGARRWQREELVVHLARAVPGTSPGPKVVLTAYSDPSLLPRVLCPEAPVLPPNPRGRPGSAGQLRVDGQGVVSR